MACLHRVPAEREGGGIVPGAGFENFRGAAQHDPAEPGPILVPAIDDKRKARIFREVAHPLQRDVAALRFFVERDVDRFRRNGVADRDDVRDAAAVGGREMTDTAGLEKMALLIAEHARSCVAASRLPTPVADRRIAPAAGDMIGPERP